jgi:predicted RNA-binding Zn-ribbon protein involved in translation (DUF1610 family)
MKMRPWPWALNGLAAMSAVVCVVSAAGWIRGYFATDFFDYIHGKWELTLVVIDKSILLHTVKSEHPQTPQGWTYDPAVPDPGYTAKYNPTIWGKLGFFTDRARGTDEIGPFVKNTVGVPFWLLCLVTAVPPLALVRSVRRRVLWLKSNRCLACGYDLRATTDRCPECGKVTAAKPPESARIVANPGGRKGG